MKKIRIIPRLDVKGPNVVKGIQLEGLRVIGNPSELAKKYYEQGADEILYMDIVASLYERNNLLDVVKNTVSRGVFIPMTVGGGIRKLSDIQQILRAGADKVAINTAATRNPEFITEAAEMFGSQCIVGSIEAKKISANRWEAYIDNGREKTGLNALNWAKKLSELGAGELLITSVDHEGMQKGYDLDLIKRIVESVNVPVIVSGGAGKKEDISVCLDKTRCNAISMASILHYNHTTIQDIKKFLGHLPIREDTSRLHVNRGKNKIISLIDYGLGNLTSVISGFREIGCQIKLVKTAEEIAGSESLVLPGVGAFGEGMNNLKKLGLIHAIKEYAGQGKPIMGICLGMQLLFSESEEFGTYKGLDIIKGKVIKLREIPEMNMQDYSIPHTGWNSLLQNRSWDRSILENIPPESDCYFVHSYYVDPDDQDHILATTSYGNQEFCSVVKKDNIYGCQFHPEKSGKIGLKILKSFSKL